MIYIFFLVTLVAHISFISDGCCSKWALLSKRITSLEFATPAPNVCVRLRSDVSVSRKVHTIYGTFKKSQQIYMLLNKWQVENGHRRRRRRHCSRHCASTRIRMVHFICLVAHIILFRSFGRRICPAIQTSHSILK